MATFPSPGCRRASRFTPARNLLIQASNPAAPPRGHRACWARGDGGEDAPWCSVRRSAGDATRRAARLERLGRCRRAAAAAAPEPPPHHRGRPQRRLVRLDGKPHAGDAAPRRSGPLLASLRQHPPHRVHLRAVACGAADRARAAPRRRARLRPDPERRPDPRRGPAGAGLLHGRDQQAVAHAPRREVPVGPRSPRLRTPTAPDRRRRRALPRRSAPRRPSLLRRRQPHRPASTRSSAARWTDGHRVSSRAASGPQSTAGRCGPVPPSSRASWKTCRPCAGSSPATMRASAAWTRASALCSTRSMPGGMPATRWSCSCPTTACRSRSPRPPSIAMAPGRRSSCAIPACRRLHPTGKW